MQCSIQCIQCIQCIQDWCTDFNLSPHSRERPPVTLPTSN